MEDPMSNMAYDVFLVFWRVVINIFFREIRPRGAFNIPRDGPLILVAAPHHNQFLDSLILMSETFRESRRRTHCLIAAASMKRKVVGFFAKMQGSIPVSRAADNAKRGSGVVKVSPSDPCLLVGLGTRFLSQVSVKSQILLPKSVNAPVAEVVQILSDTELRIKREFGGEKGTGRIREKVSEIEKQGQSGLEYKILPHIDQKDMYSYVYNCLQHDECIGIFPEGGSHDRTDLLPLKAGVTLMALGAMANNPSLKVKIVPVGLSYFHPHRFRSRAVIEYGSAMDVPPELVELFKSGGDNKREACGKLMNMIYDGLKTVTLRTPDYETLMLIQAARRLYKTPGQHLTLGQVVELNKRFMHGYEHFKDEPRVQSLRDNVLKYNRLVRDMGLRDHQVPRATKATWKILGLTLYRIGLLIVWASLALPGLVLNGPIFLLASIISRKRAKEALAASTVKIAGRDVLATWKILVSLGVAPILYGVYALITFVVASKANLSTKWCYLSPVVTIIALPFIGYGALKFGEAGMDVLKSLRPLIVSLFPGQQKHLHRLKRMRTDLSNELADVISEFGPRLYDDFDQWRILVPSASVPASGSSTGLWRRKSNVGAVDAQGNLLVHPMTWLDERLFGWSRSWRRGTSAWADSVSTSTETSRHGTPETTDDEDAGDYDDIIGHLRGLEAANGSQKSKPKSARGSYADLQQLRLSTEALPMTKVYQKTTPLSAFPSNDHLACLGKSQSQDNTNAESQSTHVRTSPRQRRASLSSDVAVERIREEDPQGTFQDVTKKLNRQSGDDLTTPT